MYGMPAPSRVGRNVSACWLYEPTTATTPFLTAARAHREAATLSLRSLQVITSSSRPLMPPPAFTQRAYALAKAGIPGLLVALVFSGAQVMTVIGSSLSPPGPGTTPHPATRTVAASAPVVRAPARNGREVRRGRRLLRRRLRLRGLPVMFTHDSPTWSTTG
ncbi:hypothetical protein SHIRM173S_10273 [Streptomyces hirsutus]